MTYRPEKPDEPAQGIFTLSRPERIALLVIFAIGLAYVLWKLLTPAQVPVNLGEDIPHPGGGMVIEVEGAVVTPGLVYLPKDATVGDAIEAAGGFASNAERDALDLEEALVDGQRIDVPWKNEGGSSRTGRSGSVEFEPVDYPVSNGESPPVEIPSGLVNINTANSYELQSLPGIGEELAERIIAYRMSHGRFERIEEIMEVEGIGEGKFEDMRRLITVGE